MAKKANNVFTFLIFLHCWGTNYLRGIHPSDTRDTGGGISHRKQHSPHNSSHGCPWMSHGFLFQTKKLVTNPSVTQSVIIRVKLNLRLKDTNENHGDNASHRCPRMNHGFFITRLIFGPTDQREVIINYRIHFSYGCSRIPSAIRCRYRSSCRWLLVWRDLLSLCHSPQTFCLYFST